MKDFRQRKQKKNRQNKQLQYSILIFLLIIVLAFILRASYKMYERKKRVDSEHIKFNDKYENLLRRRDTLQGTVDVLKTENGIKEEIKKTYSVGEEGEYIIYITE